MFGKWIGYMVFSFIVVISNSIGSLCISIEGFTDKLTRKMARKAISNWDEMYGSLTPEMKIKLLVEHWRVHSIDDMLK